MSAFTLTFSPVPDADSPLRAAAAPWDSELFGFPCWELRLDGEPSPALADALARFVAARREAGECLLAAKIPTQQVASGRLLTAHGFYVVETLLDISLPLTRLQPIAARIGRREALRPATPDDLESIARIAGAAFRCDRFHLDPSLPVEKADLRYRSWVERGLRDGEPLFVYAGAAGAIRGFFHLRELPEAGVDLALAAVHPSCQGTGIGALMYQAVLEECRRRGYRSASTRIAVNNLPVANLVFRLGFTIREAVYTYHYHHRP